MRDFIRQGVLDLRSVRILVVDEADAMLDGGFIAEVRDVRDHIARHRNRLSSRQLEASGELQTCMLSATFPESVRAIAAEFLHAPVRMQVGATGETSANVVQAVVRVCQGMKLEHLCHLAACGGQALVFCRTKQCTDAVCMQLKDALHAGRSAALHTVTEALTEQGVDLAQFRQAE